MSTFKIVFKQIGPDRWQEYHDGAPVGVVTEIPYYAKPVDPEEEAETRRLRKAEDDYHAYARRVEDPAFVKNMERLRSIAAEMDPEEVRKIDTDFGAFTEAYDNLKAGDVMRRHNERIAAIQDRQHSINGMERNQADLDLMALIEERDKALVRIRNAEYSGPEEE